MRNKIYYLLDFHMKCLNVIGYGDDTIEKYCKYVNSLLDTFFSSEQQIQLKMNNFNYELLYKFAFEDVDDISFDNLDENILCDFFDKISFIDIKSFY